MHYVDDNFQKHLEEFDRIKAYSADVIKSNAPKMDPMRKWKNEIRGNLINVRNEFVSWVDTFTNQFIR